MENRSTTISITGVGKEETQNIQSSHASTSNSNVLERVSDEVFKYDHLDRKLNRHHITGKTPANSARTMY